MVPGNDTAAVNAFLSGVSRETRQRLEVYHDLLAKWTKRINLVSRKTTEQIWHRHILDSAQVHSVAPGTFDHWLDLGSGGGLPGVVCAILSEGNPKFTLVDSDQRKATFLRTVARSLDLNIQVYACRIDELPPQKADVISARALAPLTSLLEMAKPHSSDFTTYIFPKGAQSNDEIVQAEADWHFKLNTRPSITEPTASILIIGDVTRA